MAARLLARGRTVRVPRGFGWWLLFLVWMCLSFISLSGELPLRVPVAHGQLLLGHRHLHLHLQHAARPAAGAPAGRSAGRLLDRHGGRRLARRAPSERPDHHAGRANPPGSLASHEFVQILVHPIFAQVQEVLGYPLGRPTAPFLYTNDWGGVYALTIPFFILGWLQSGRAARRTMALLLLGASLVPALLSLNRGLWVSLLIAVALRRDAIG